MNWKLPYVQAELENAEEPEIQLPTYVGSHKKQGKLKKKKKTYTSVSLTMLMPLTVCITKNCGKFLKTWQYQTTFLSPEMQDMKQQLELNMEQWSGSKLGKEYTKTAYCQLAYLIYMQSTSCEIPVWMTHKLESRLTREISATSGMQMIPL